MSTRFFIEAHEDCERCDGAGTVQNFRWARYWRENPKGIADPVEWFKATYEMNNRQIPLEDDPCTRCRGEGVVVKKVELAEALKRLGSLV